MKNFLLYLNMALGLWITLVSAIEGFQTTSTITLAISGTALLLVLFSAGALLVDRRWMYRFAIFLAFCLLVLPWFISGSLRWQTLVVGALTVILLIIAGRLRPVARNFILHAQDGSTLMEVKKLEFKGANLIIRGKMMGAMPTVAHMRPEEVWKALTLIPLNVLLRFPILLFKAWRTAGKFPKAQDSKQKSIDL